MSVPWTSIGRQLIERLAFLGVDPSDDDELRLQKVTLTLAALTVTVLAVVWVGTYLALSLPLSAAIPFAYQVISIASLAVFARTKDYRFLRFSQLVLIILLPFLLQWSPGGYAASSAVSLWTLVGAFGIAGGIGRDTFIYDLWGDTVNTASRMESSGLPGRIQVTAAVYARLRDRCRFEDRGEIDVKGKGRLRAYLLVGPVG